jgi:hypothetical protein
MSSASEFLDWMREYPRKAGLLAAFTGGSVVGVSIIVVPHLFQTLPVSWRILLRTAGALFWWGVLAVIFGDLNPVRLLGKTVLWPIFLPLALRDLVRSWQDESQPARWLDVRPPAPPLSPPTRPCIVCGMPHSANDEICLACQGNIPPGSELWRSRLS